MNDESALAKITWQDPKTGEIREYVLMEGATAMIGRSPGNDICVPERHVSRKHAVINYRDGIFMITDLGSANGTYVNDQKLTDPFPLAGGDVIRLFVPVLHFSAVVTEEEQTQASLKGTLIVPHRRGGGGPSCLSPLGRRRARNFLWRQIPSRWAGLPSAPVLTFPCKIAPCRARTPAWNTIPLRMSGGFWTPPASTARLLTV